MCRSIVYRQKYAAGVSIFLLNNKSRVRAREEFRSNAKVILAHGYEKYRDRPFYVPTPLGERLMIPPQYVDELRSAWMDDVDFLGTFKEMFEGKYTTFGDRSQLHPTITRGPLTQNIETRKADGAHKSVDAVQWMMDEAKGRESDSKFIANIVLKLSFASIHTSSGVLLNILYNLCYRAEYIEPLRTEARKVLDEEGQWNRNALEKLVKLDSFMIESQRFSPLLLSE
ncbi:MAG: hypothetical protein Q9159_006307 [Coniocarpon cinnabarinum]